MFHHFIIYEFMLCSAVSIALLLLILWHAHLVHFAETSIELHINRGEAGRCKQKGLVSVVVIHLCRKRSQVGGVTRSAG